MRQKRAQRTPDPHRLNLALQGGGAHGAFTWGVLDALLDDNRIDIDGVTATSAGAMNAALLAQGLHQERGGADRARELLEKFWRKISEAGAVFSPVQRSALEWMAALNPMLKHWSLDHSPGYFWFEQITSLLSPYQFNPMNYNPLRQILMECIDFDELHDCRSVRLFITATNVHTGMGRVFKNKDITLDVLCASAALPFLFQAVSIDDEPYWDGGYMGNPSLWPLFYETGCTDVLLVHINPIVRREWPRETYAIQNRLNEITFNASLLHELRAVAFVQKLIRDDMLTKKAMDRYRDIRLHALRAEESLSELSVASKFDTSWPFLCQLRDRGREAAKEWLGKHRASIGVNSTVSIPRDYLGRG